ncbi:FAD-binding oxidoreductase [Metallosphaera cuprina]|uniref:FAD linked oxidase domain-containing protein n=1 Tax=Metallosphaera cuprina (strain Ar-4) TaxID=1006006 RepID=F4FZF0_METCR|nr:FAD-binding oxidoreductase [Metallosphaera cuprina]AEB95640.1 FAD linked oxidase domain-containing protein [Metallosphaera cuprina Ar-4]
MWIDELEKVTKVRQIKEKSGSVLVQPESELEFKEVIKLANQRQIKVHVIGTGENHIGEPVNADLLVSTRGLVGILESSQSDLYVRVKAGTPFRDLVRALDKSGLWIPFYHTGTVGGFSSLNFPFHYSLFYGYPRDWLIGAKSVTGLGEIIRTGDRTPKFSSGYKIWKAMSGALGKLGAYLEITLKVIPKPEETFPAQIKVSEIWKAISKGAIGITIYRKGEERAIAWFSGHSSYVRKVVQEYRQADIPKCSGSTIYSIITVRGLELENTQNINAECIVSFFGSGYSRIYNGEDLLALREKGYNVIGEKGCYRDCLPKQSETFKILKSALDPNDILI